MARYFSKLKKNFSSPIQLIRIELLFAILFEQFFSFLFNSISNTAFNYKIVGVFSIVFITIFILSFWVKEVRKNLRSLSNFVYLSGILFVIYTAYDNNFDKDTFFVVILVYTFINFMFSSLKIFWRFNAYIFSVLFFFLFLTGKNTEIPFFLIITPFFVIGIAGLCLTVGREYYRKRLKERQQLLTFIFNQSNDGLILTDKSRKKIIEANDTFVRILGFNKREDLLDKKTDEVKLNNIDLLEDVDIGTTKSYELNDGRIITKEVKEVSYKSNNYFLVQIKEFLNKKELNLSVEFEVLKTYSEESYQSIFETSASFICIINKEGIIIDVNETLSKFLGYSKKEIIGNNYNRVDYINYNKEREVINENVWSGKVEQFEKKLVGKNGELLYVEIILQRGKYFGQDVFISNSRDITERKELEKKVIYNYRQYKTLFDESPISIIISDLKGEIREINNAFVKLIGYNEKELIGMNLSAISHKADLEINNKLRKQLIDGDIQSMHMEKRYYTKDGRILFTLLKAILQRDEKGNPNFLRGQIVDITEIVRAKKEIKNSEKSYKDVFNNTYELLYILNNKNKFLDVNNSVINKYGFSKEEIIGKGPAFLSAEGKNDLVEVEKRLDLARKGKEQHLLWYNRKKDGSIFPKELRIRKGVYFGEEVLIGSGRDISEQIAYEQKLENSRKKYKELIDTSVVGIIIYSNKKIVFANSKVLEILDLSDKNQLLDKEEFHFIKESDRTVFNKRLDLLNKMEDVPMMEYTILDSNNNKIEVEIKPKKIDFEGEKAIMISLLDISDRRKAEEAVRRENETKSANINLKDQLKHNRDIQKRLIKAQAYAEGIIESSLDMIFTATKDGKIERLNLSAMKELHYESESEYRDLSFKHIFEGIDIKEEILKKVDGDLSYSGEVIMKRKDGSSFNSFMSLSKLRSKNSDNLGLMAISRDITDIKAKENEIKEQASKLKAIIESDSHFFFTLNKEFVFTSFNNLFKEDLFSKYGIKVKVGDLFFAPFFIDNEIANEQDYNLWKTEFNKCFNGENVKFEIDGKDLKGNFFCRDVFLDPVNNEFGKAIEIAVLSHDTTEKKVAENQLQSSLAEKNVLLKEVHHRVKNNMQVISSILNLQSSYVKDEETVNILKESQSRIRAMAAIHERLYRTENFSNIKFSSYLKNLSENLVSTYDSSDKRIDLSCKLDEVFLTLDSAIPCGLIINELISNSLKYAFVGRSRGKIEVGLNNKEGKVTFTIKDNGIGFPQDVDFRNTDSLGLQLVNTLVEQIEGTIDQIKKEGTTYIIVFSPNHMNR